MTVPNTIGGIAVVRLLKTLVRRLWNLYVRLLSTLVRGMTLAGKVAIRELLERESIGCLDYRKKILVCVDSRSVLARLNSCKKEPETVKWIETSFHEHDVFYDIGANIGAYSLVASNFLEGKIRVYAFEPGMTTYPVLCKNIIINGFERSIIPLNVALSAQSGAENFKYRNLSAGAAEHKGLIVENLATSQFIDEEVFTQWMPVFRLDDFVRGFRIEKPTHIKIDCDGFEYPVLSGAEQTLESKSVQSVQVEIDERSEAAEKTVKLMLSHSYYIDKKNRHGNSSIYDYIFRRTVSR